MLWQIKWTRTNCDMLLVFNLFDVFWCGFFLQKIYNFHRHTDVVYLALCQRYFVGGRVCFLSAFGTFNWCLFGWTINPYLFILVGFKRVFDHKFIFVHLLVNRLLTSPTITAPCINEKNRNKIFLSTMTRLYIIH